MSAAKIYNWNAEKNQQLLEERGISFERIVFEISIGNERAVLLHPNQVKYPGQLISVVEVDDYVYLVPFVETDSEIFLKTIIPSRKATRQFRSKP
jgi:uncharacterized DUF497 family protein